MNLYYDIKVFDRLSNKASYMFSDFFDEPYCISSGLVSSCTDQDEEIFIIREMFEACPDIFENFVPGLILYNGLSEVSLVRMYPVAFDLINHIWFYDDKKPEYVYYSDMNGFLKRKIWSEYEKDSD